jgi:hypothetical protein
MDVLSSVVNREIQSSPTDLPAHFPDVVQPAFKEGELLRWISASEKPIGESSLADFSVTLLTATTGSGAT